MRFFTLVFILQCNCMLAQTLPIPENLVSENIPALQSSIVNDVKVYTESRSASFIEWHPTKKEMLISTRFGNANQLHYVKMAGGDRKQITFFDEPIATATFDPNGNFILFLKDKGGDEFTHIYRIDLPSQKVTQLTEGEKTQDGGMRWSHNKTWIAYNSTKRNKKDRDFYTMDPKDPNTSKLVCENEGGGWDIVDWSPDDKQLLIEERKSITDHALFILDLASKTKTKILPLDDIKGVYNGICYNNEGTGIYLTTDKDSEFQRLAYFDLKTKKLDFITTSINWDIEQVKMSRDGKQVAFVSNEDGLSKLYLMPTATNKFVEMPGIPVGVISGIEWNGSSDAVGFSINTYDASSDAFEYDFKKKKLSRWTESELGGVDPTKLSAPQLINWKSFDARMISGFMYKASSNFKGKRPVLIVIHGGPESQWRPGFLARSNYYTNELGITIVNPNVRGSTGYGKTFVDLDNGFKRMESVQDIGALLDWIKTQPDLDADRIMVMGGSYGGFMSLAVSYVYSDRIRCAVDVVGISNFSTFMKNTEAYRRDLRRVEYGDERIPEMKEFFEKIAPLNNVDKIKKPLFIVQGGNDPRVPLTEAEQMRDKIKAAGGTVWYLMAKDEGHGFKKKNNIDFQFYSTIEFMKKYLLN
jgi:dipeptidyl aminopeptidase/acylaminoacyl peptidase